MLKKLLFKIKNFLKQNSFHDLQYYLDHILIQKIKYIYNEICYEILNDNVYIFINLNDPYLVFLEWLYHKIHVNIIVHLGIQNDVFFEYNDAKTYVIDLFKENDDYYHILKKKTFLKIYRSDCRDIFDLWKDSIDILFLHQEDYDENYMKWCQFVNKKYGIIFFLKCHLHFFYTYNHEYILFNHKKNIGIYTENKKIYKMIFEKKIYNDFSNVTLL
jgi:hypothetical protein